MIVDEGNINIKSELSYPKELSAIILAGGQGSRVNYQQKALLLYKGQPIIKSILTSLANQVSYIWINANTEIERYKPFLKTIYSDQYPGYLGPLSGMHAAWQHITTDWAVFVPCDNPHIPDDFVERLVKAYEKQPNPIVTVFDGERLQPLYMLMHRSMASSLAKAIDIGHLSVNRWVKENAYTKANFASCCPNTFKNMNTLNCFLKANSKLPE